MNYSRNSCGCQCAGNMQRAAQRTVETTRCAAELPVMAYVPVQSFGARYPELMALERGTLFTALDKPFCGKGGCACE